MKKRLFIWIIPVILVLMIAALYPVLIRVQAGAKGNNTVSGNESTVSGDAVSGNAVSGNAVSGDMVSQDTADEDPVREIFLERPEVTVISKTNYTVKLTWKKVKKATNYMVYRCRKKDGRYKCIGVTDKKKFIDTDVKHYVTYYYVVCAVRADSETGEITAKSRFSKICHASIYMSPPKVSLKTAAVSKIEIGFTRSKHTEVCNIYRSMAPDSGFYKIGSTVENTFIDKKVEPNTTYYYKVLGKCVNSDGRIVWSTQSNILKAETKTVYDKTVYVGDSIIHGFIDYGYVTSKSTREKVIAKVGVGTKGFYESELMDDLKKVGTARVFIMLGINSLWSEDSIPGIIQYYKLIVDDLKKSCPDADIVCLSLAPTTSTAKIKNSNIDKFNAALEVMAADCGVSYYDFTSGMKDSNGYLMTSKSGNDGIHWTKSTYDDVVKALRDYGK